MGLGSELALGIGGLWCYLMWYCGFWGKVPAGGVGLVLGFWVVGCCHGCKHIRGYLFAVCRWLASRRCLWPFLASAPFGFVGISTSAVEYGVFGVGVVSGGASESGCRSMRMFR